MPQNPVMTPEQQNELVRQLTTLGQQRTALIPALQQQLSGADYEALGPQLNQALFNTQGPFSVGVGGGAYSPRTYQQWLDQLAASRNIYGNVASQYNLTNPLARQITQTYGTAPAFNPGPGTNIPFAPEVPFGGYGPGPAAPTPQTIMERAVPSTAAGYPQRRDVSLTPVYQPEIPFGGYGQRPLPTPLGGYSPGPAYPTPQTIMERAVPSGARFPSGLPSTAAPIAQQNFAANFPFLNQGGVPGTTQMNAFNAATPPATSPWSAGGTLPSWMRRRQPTY